VAARPGQHIRTRPQHDRLAWAEDAAGVLLPPPLAAEEEASVLGCRPGVYDSRILGGVELAQPT